MVAEYESNIVGFIVYELHKSSLHIVNLAVSPAFRRREVGRQMVVRLVDKLCMPRRDEIYLTVRECNLDAQLFFRSQGFRAKQVLREHYEDSGEDGYVLQYRVQPEPLEFATHNRIFTADGRIKPA